MVEGRITDGRRIAQLLASEIEGHEGGELGALSVVDAAPDAAGGARAYDVADGEGVLARVFVGEEEARLEFARGDEAVRSATFGDRDDIVVHTDGERTVLEVGSGAAVKPATRALAAAAA
ncbi:MULTISPECIES: hypothetical protein [Saliphagus]|uniref:DUF7993 domain-containing protein n=1 Tax=Saliphagus infecundisoli TaxID=1849069 RepID=A0ABD5QEI9_9EURY|nr:MULTISPECIES: hypothetical protein [Saliphagus]